MRMFTAVRPPPDVLGALDAFLEPRRDEGPWRWALPDAWHLTLAFMPEVPEPCLDDLQARLVRAASRRTPFRLRLSGGGAFPNPSRARVLYAGVDATPEARTELARLATGCRAAASKAGAPPAGTAFRPHLTLGRVRHPVEATRWIRLLDAFGTEPFTVTQIELVASFLGEGPHRSPRHEVVERFALGGRGKDFSPGVRSNTDETESG